MRDTLTTYIANCIVQAAEDKEKHGEGGEEQGEEAEDAEQVSYLEQRNYSVIMTVVNYDCN